MNKEQIQIVGGTLGGILAALMAISFFLSAARQLPMHGPNCEELFIDKMEPFVSTRWFCEVDPTKRNGYEEKK